MDSNFPKIVAQSNGIDRSATNTVYALRSAEPNEGESTLRSPALQKMQELNDDFEKLLSEMRNENMAGKDHKNSI